MRTTSVTPLLFLSAICFGALFLDISSFIGWHLGGEMRALYLALALICIGLAMHQVTGSSYPLTTSFGWAVIGMGVILFCTSSIMLVL